MNLFITPADNHRFVIYCCGVHHFDCGPFFASLLLVAAIDFDPHSLSISRESVQSGGAAKRTLPKWSAAVGSAN